MSREILFRGKTENGLWRIGYLSFEDKITIKRKCYDYKGDYVATSIEEYKIDKNTVGQFTGLTDKNGKKIFEGDIIRYADESEYRCYLESLESPEDYEGVSFNDLWTIDEVVYGINIGYPAFDLNNHEWEINGLSCLNDSGQYFYEVIGNIHDNPELMEKTK